MFSVHILVDQRIPIPVDFCISVDRSTKYIHSIVIVCLLIDQLNLCGGVFCFFNVQKIIFKPRLFIVIGCDNKQISIDLKQDTLQAYTYVTLSTIELNHKY